MDEKWLIVNEWNYKPNPNSLPETKDRLARIKHSIQINNHDNCLHSRSSCGSSFICIGSVCGVHFVQQSTTKLLSTIKYVAKQKSEHSRIIVKVGSAINILNGVDTSSWWVGRVQSMRWHNGKQFGVLRQAVDLLAWMKELGWRNPNNPYIEVMLQYYRKHPGRNKFKYDHTDSKQIAIDCIISTIIMRYNSTNEVYTLDRNDLVVHVQVCDRTNYIGFMTKLDVFHIM